MVWLRRANRSALLPVQEGIMAATTLSSGYSSRGPTLKDCQSLWDTLVTEYVTDLGMRVIFQTAKLPAYRACVQVWSPGLDPNTGGPRDHIWATRDLHNAFDAITYAVLFDLLIHAYREMQGFFGGQEELPLSGSR